ncbi:MAG: hypothetical protein M0030_29105, partial [Actinomycetota bacterium]|nr:hypothetical protein [Actinomycetota bacterium]
GRPQPQTTVEPPGGPFVRHSQPGRRAMYNTSGVTFGGLVAQPLVAAPGYTRGFRLKIVATGGTGTSVTVAADNPGNIASLVQLKDSFGTPLIVAPGYEALQLLQLYGGQFGLGTESNVLNMTTFSPVAAASGNFTFSTYLPLEFAKAYGVISSANASLLPTLQFNVNTAAGFYGTTVPTTLPTMQFVVDQDFYWLPEGVSVEPPGIGTTEQWIYQPANPTIGSGASLNVQLPRLGGYLSVIIAELRDSTQARVDAWPTRLRWLVDGVPLIDSEITSLYEDMAIGFGVGALYGATNTTAGTAMNARPTGTIAINRKNGLSQQSMGLFDTGETYLSTNPGTQVEFSGNPWGSITNSPATLNALCGQVVPSGALIQGLPEV